LGSIRQYNSIYRILFEIKIPSNYKFHRQRPFIDLTSEKNTILFFIGSIFRINTVVFDINNDCWIVQLTIYDERINDDFSPLFTFLNDQNSSITLANLLRQISPKSAEDFYRYILKENSETFSKLQCYRGLGLCSYSRDDYGQALIYFEKALQMKTNDQLIRSSLHNSIGLVYAQQDEIDQAHIHFFEALKSSSSPLHSACVHHNLALISSRKGLYDEELDHYQEAFQIRTEQLPANHLQLASLYNNIGIAHSDMHQYDQALSNLRKALEMRLKLLSDSHVDVAKSYANIGTVYARTQELQMALEYFTKAQLLFEKQSNICEQDLNELNKNIKIINDKLR
jgi:tetratricopeptide (TPR) repeat protein